MKAFSEFYDLLLPQVPGCPLPMADLHLRMAARVFCSETLCWQEWLDPVTTDGAAVVFSFNKSGQTDIVELLRATLDAKEIEVLRKQDVPGDWRVASWAGPTAFAINAASQFALVPVQASGLAFKAEVALRPALSAIGVADPVFKRYAEAIAYGAASTLAALPKKPYSDPATAAHASAQFSAAIHDTATEVMHAFSAAPARVRAHFL